jgi:CHAD domain-containing protein
MRATEEYERKLDAPVGFQLPPLGGEQLEPRSFTSVYYDVPGGSLAASGITLRRRTEQGRSVWQLKLPSDDGFRLELEESGGPIEAPARLAQLLRVHLRRGPLEPVAELRTRRRGELVARDGSRAAVTLDEVSIMDARRVRDSFVEVEVELRSGDPRQLDVIARELRDAGAQRGADTPKLFRAIALVEEPLHGSGTIEALRAGLLEQLGAIEAQDPGTRLGRDPESLHDMRVAVRRARALFRTGRRVICGDTKSVESGLKELGRVLGDVRDLDVLIERLRTEAEELDHGDREAFRAAIAALTDERAAARRRLLHALDSDLYLRLIDDLERTARELTPNGDASTLPDLVDRQAYKLRKIAKSLPKNPADDELHALRKAGKRTRYAAELAGDAKIVKRARRLQNVLGEHQDAVVAGERLRELAAAGDARLAFAAGRIAEREEARRREARRRWPTVWQRLKKTL